MCKSTLYKVSLHTAGLFITDSFIAYIDMIYKTVLLIVENSVNLSKCV